MSKKKGTAIYTNDGVSSPWLMPRLLQPVGYEIIWVESWWDSKQELLQKAIEFSPDVIIIDDASLHSLAACQKLKANQNTKNIPIVFITCRNENERVSPEEARANGVDFVWDKSISIDEFITILEGYLPS